VTKKNTCFTVDLGVNRLCMLVKLRVKLCSWTFISSTSVPWWHYFP